MEEITSTNRRDVLKSLSVTGAALTGISPVAAGSDEFTAIETAHINGGENIFDEVPIDWLNLVKEAQNAIESLTDDYGGADFVDSVFRHSSEESIHGFRTPKIGVSVHDIASDKVDTLPEKVNGYKVHVEPAKELHLDAHNEDSFCEGGESSSDTPQGGSRVVTGHSNRLSALGRVVYGGEECWATSTHGFEYPSEGELWYGYDDSDPDMYVGRVQEYLSEDGYDIAVVSVESYGIDDVSCSIHDTTRDVSGYVTEGGIEYMTDYDETAYHYGAKTCHTEGQVEGYRSRNGVRDVELTTDAAGGDSGGPHYRRVRTSTSPYQAAVIIGIHKWHSEICDSFTCYHERSYAPAAHDIQDNLDLQFGC
ncbi:MULTISPECIES: hypothetical protein [Natrialbaceae]|uniref:hypothetical protein n=1 Tax=Natrialbaceae TaxID=1644061 RepID=UPI00207D33D1|nr:hypothetical protein [Natronococcus sp. CG52]